MWFLSYLPRSWIAGSYGSYLFMRNCWTISKWLNKSAHPLAMKFEISWFFSLLEEVIERVWLLVDLHEQDPGLLIHFLNNAFDEKKFLILEKPKWSLFSFVVCSLWLTYRIFSQPKVTKVFSCVFFWKVCGSSFDI